MSTLKIGMGQGFPGSDWRWRLAITLFMPVYLVEQARARLERLVSPARFCDYCDCADCREGRKWLLHAMTVDGKWVCDVCWLYDCCTRWKREHGELCEPCANMKCLHRPTLATGFGPKGWKTNVVHLVWLAGQSIDRYRHGRTQP